MFSDEVVPTKSDYTKEIMKRLQIHARFRMLKIFYSHCSVQCILNVKEKYNRFSGSFQILEYKCYNYLIAAT